MVGLLMLINTHFGDGLHETTLTRENFFTTQKISVAAGVFYQAAFPAIKTTFLLQYRRTFPLPMFQRICSIFIGFIIAFCIGQVVSLGFVCIPLRSLWDATVPGRCFDRLAWWFVGSSISLVTDVAIVIMPLPLLRTIQLPWRQKAVLMATFALGFFTCAISIVRITILQSSSTMIDATYDTTIAGIWSITELSCAIICVCVPTLRPLLKRKDSRTLPPLWLRPKINDSGTTERFTQSDGGGHSSQRRQSGARYGLLPAAQQLDVEQTRNSGVRPRSLPPIELDDVSGLPLPPPVHLTPSGEPSLQISPWNDVMVPLARCDTEEGVGFLDSTIQDPEQPTLLKPPPRRHTSMTPSPAVDGYFDAIVWDESNQPRLPGSRGSA
ncbi:integral membrane protein [Colletotrichum somersetense]|nr:integral membrane protein [Colletotrichum somersetense]